MERRHPSSERLAAPTFSHKGRRKRIYNRSILSQRASPSQAVFSA